MKFPTSHDNKNKTKNDDDDDDDDGDDDDDDDDDSNSNSNSNNSNNSNNLMESSLKNYMNGISQGSICFIFLASIIFAGASSVVTVVIKLLYQTSVSWNFKNPAFLRLSNDTCFFYSPMMTQN